ncbi:glycosyltransferase family 87 protein [Caballeronia insecticola]|uniref:Putative prenyltransferase UbiA family n=1 Tax=Caballeronia insecticola TaxID=758793 RepID=R4WZ50_9BURK|nr:glycosyltransferase family 87 protein [Caballeronia insecticola]BAN26920.1 putative prenyltransferase UbiA family [Caballeronia insecticola]
MNSRQTFGSPMQHARPTPPETRTRALLLRAALIVFVLLPAADLISFAILRLWLHKEYAPTLGFVWAWARSTWWHSTAIDDSWAPMRAALDWLHAHAGGNLYDRLFFVDHVKFQYAPSALLPLRALEALSLDSSDAALNRFDAWVILLNAATCGLIAYLLAGRSDTNARFRWHWAILATLATLTYFPLQRAFVLGQVQVWNNALFALAALAWILDRRLLAGALIGLICLLKPQFLLFILWAVLRREWRFCAGWLGVVVIGGVTSLIVFGLSNHLGYLAVLRALSRTGEAYIANQSINGFLNRLVGTDATPDIWKANDFPVYSPIVYLGTLCTSAVLIGAALLAPLRTRAQSRLFDFLCGALTFTIASPIAWEHHFGIAPVIFLVLVLSLAVCAPSKTRTIALVVLSASYFVTGVWLRGSWMLAGVLATLGLVYWSMFSASVRDPTTGPPAARSRDTLTNPQSPT